MARLANVAVDPLSCAAGRTGETAELTFLDGGCEGARRWIGGDSAHYPANATADISAMPLLSLQDRKA